MNTTLLFTGGMFELVLDDEQMRRASEFARGSFTEVSRPPVAFWGTAW